MESLSNYFREELASKFNQRSLDFIWNEIMYSYKERKEDLGEQLSGIITRLKEDEPIQYILGRAYFYDIELAVDSSTLIPRPETEELVDIIINDQKNKAIDILDIGTGSACIALCLAKHLPESNISALDVSEAALKVAARNASELNLNIELIHVDICNVAQLDKKYHLIVSNPPYIPHSEKVYMEKNVLNYEPSGALFVSDNDPLLFYRKIAELALDGMHPSGYLYFECNEFNAINVQHILVKLGFKEVELFNDMQDKARMIRCQKGSTD